MSLTVSQMPANRLPAELVNNAAFVKKVDFDPVHQTDETGQPAEKIHGSALPCFDTVLISAEGIAAQALKLTRLSHTDGMDMLSLDATGESVEEKEWLKGDPNGDSFPVVLGITDHAALDASQHRNEIYSQLVKSWNSLMNQLKHERESKGYDYFKTIKLFCSRSAEWENDLQQSDPAVYQVWLDKFKMLSTPPKEQLSENLKRKIEF